MAKYQFRILCAENRCNEVCDTMRSDNFEITEQYERGLSSDHLAIREFDSDEQAAEYATQLYQNNSEMIENITILE